MVSQVTKSLGVALFLILTCFIETQGCEIPVFRYALERLRPETYSVLVYHRGPLSKDQETVLGTLRSGSLDDNGKGNYIVETIDLGKPADLGKRPACPASAPLPWVMVCYPRSDAAVPPAWSGPLTAGNVRLIQDSPARQELAKRLLNGETAVWVLVECGDKARDEAVAQSLLNICRKLEKTLKLPKDPEDKPKEAGEAEPHSPGIENLRIAFSVLRISRQDPAEAALRSTLFNVDKDIPAQGQPIAFAVFGRGRVFTAFAGSNLNEEAVTERASFLVLPCSCEIKGNLPGFDLMVSSDWEIPAIAENRPEPKPPLPSLGSVAPVPSPPPARGLELEKPVNPAPPPSQGLNLESETPTDPSPLPVPEPDRLYRNLALAGGGVVFLIVGITLAIVFCKTGPGWKA
jgi:hypothetical protein